MKEDHEPQGSAGSSRVIVELSLQESLVSGVVERDFSSSGKPQTGSRWNSASQWETPIGGELKSLSCGRAGRSAPAQGSSTASQALPRPGPLSLHLVCDPFNHLALHLALLEV